MFDSGNKKGQSYQKDKIAQTVGFIAFCFLRLIPLPSVTKDLFNIYIVYENCEKVNSFFRKVIFFTKNQIVPVTVMTSVPGVTVTLPVTGSCVTVAAGTVMGKLSPVGKVRRPFS